MLDDAALSAEQKARIDALLDELFDRPASERLTALRDSGERDPAIIAEVTSLLQAAEAAGEFLCAPVVVGTSAAAPELLDGERLGDWRITRLIGRGGMGDVYEALRAQGDFEQRVAIKILQRENSVQLQRFQAERQILARLEHPGIARLIDGGITGDGRPYMVMEFVAGSWITEFCDQVQATLPERLHLFMQVCDAVAYAHRNLIVHRDIKPSNILVTAGRDVKLLDFGIAKLLDVQQAQSTLASTAFMTPSCASPEQLTGAPITTATDVYALGLLLFELLTGVHPWMESNTPVLQALRIVLERPLPLASRTAATRPPSKPPSPVMAAALRGDLDAIIAKALRSEPAHRYATVEGLKLDIGRVLRGEPIAARDGAHWYVFGRVVRRYRWAAVAIVAVIVSLAGGLGVAAWQAQRASAERDIARRDAAREEAVRYSLTSLFRASISEQGAQSATAKTMIDGSAQRVLREYRDQPQLSGEIVLTLADLYQALEDVTGAATLLEGYIAEADPKADPTALADARQKLAGLEMMRGHTDRAALLLDQSDAYWRIDTRNNAEERLEGLGLRARLQRLQGNFDASIATSRHAIAERIALSGHDHRETAILYNSLAISLNAANRLDEALAAYAETNAIYRNLGLADGLDAQIILANTGVQALRTGKLADAESLLKNAVEHERLLAGDSAAVAAGLGYYSKVLTITDRAAAAVPAARDAVTIGDKYAGPASPVSLLNRLFLGEAQTAVADYAGARTTLLAAHEAASRQYGPSHTLTLRTQLALAQLEIAEGSYAGALTGLQKLVPLIRTTGGVGDATLAQALDALADVQVHQGNASSAILSLKEAVGLREKLRYHTWELFEAQERLAEVLASTGDPAAPTMLKRSAADLESQLGPSHPQTVRAKKALAQL